MNQHFAQTTLTRTPPPAASGRTGKRPESVRISPNSRLPCQIGLKSFRILETLRKMTIFTLTNGTNLTDNCIWINLLKHF